jgi:hypothetical protein
MPLGNLPGALVPLDDVEPEPQQYPTSSSASVTAQRSLSRVDGSSTSWVEYRFAYRQDAIVVAWQW